MRNKLRENPLLSVLHIPAGEPDALYNNLILHGSIIVAAGLQKYTGDDKDVLAFWGEHADVINLAEKDGHIYIFGRRGNDWHTFDGPLEDSKDWKKFKEQTAS